jgi:hypothetical protein
MKPNVFKLDYVYGQVLKSCGKVAAAEPELRFIAVNTDLKPRPDLERGTRA